MRLMILVLALGCAVPGAHSQSVARPPPAAQSVPTVAERAELYQRVARIDSTSELESLARDTTAAPLDSVRRQQLELIVDRYFELDPVGAVRFAVELKSAGADFAAALYERLARTDINEALAELSQLDEVGVARVASFAVFRGLGADERAFELVSASLHGRAREEFRADSLLRIMRTAPRAAFEEAIALSDADKSRSLALTIAAHWADGSGSEAMAAAERVADPELRSLLQNTVLRSWGDADSLADYLAALDDGALQTALAAGALARLAQASPQRAAELASRLPAGEQRRSMLWTVATGYAQQDPDAALAWARNLDTPDQNVLAAILQGVAHKDPVRAFDLAGSLEEPARSQGYLAAMSSQAIDERQFATLASRALALQDGQTKTAVLVSLAGSWASRPGNADRALEWMVAAGDALPPEAFARVGHLLARTDPNAAAAYVERVPRSARNDWVAAVTAAYTSTDPQQGLAYLERFRGDPAFDGAAVAVAQQLAVSDPPAAARLLGSVRNRGPMGFGPEITIASQWSQRDPVAAASWALDLPPQPRNIALSIATNAWAQRDAAAVERWALALPRGEQRDAALTAAVRARGAAALDPALLNAFSDERLREGAVMTAIMMTASTDPAEARRLVDSHIADPRRREQAQQTIASVEQNGGPAQSAVFGVGTGPAVPLTFSPTGAIPAMIVGPAGQPLILRSPSPGLVPLPPGVGPIPPPLPPNVQREIAASDPTRDR
jgi:hypothetical protein